MDVGELLNYQPDRGAKRIREEDGGGGGGGEEAKGGKQLKGGRDLGRHRDLGSLGPGDDPDVEETTEDRKRILEKLMDRDEEEPEGEPVDESSVKKMILTFEKRSYKNQELRIKFPDNPEKFMEAELDLNDIIQEMHVIATMPDLYHLLVELNAVHSLLGLLSHENTDILHLMKSCDLNAGLHIAIAVVDLLQELTDIDTLQESEEGAEVLIDALLEGQVVALLVQNMERLDEQVKEEADGVYNTLAIVENMAEFRPGLCTEAAQQGLMQWLLKRIKVFKRHNPSTAEEQEMMENLFDSLCSCLMLSANRDRFLKGEGLQLMNLMLREKKMSRTSALRVLDHGMIGPEGTDNCHKFVDILGLRTIFPLFMKTPKRMKKVGVSEKEHEGSGVFREESFRRRSIDSPVRGDTGGADTNYSVCEAVGVGRVGHDGDRASWQGHEHVCSIISSMLRNLKAQQRSRLLSKFTENDCEKVDRLMELHFKYLEAVQQADKRIEGEKHLHQRVHQILNLRGGSVKVVRHVMRAILEPRM
ncbi:hypothetical protein CRUP_035281 [Coryphaenoides rupestris]|nr:hypothetical protein CRUP_035281 [Coryphaenoides rupestris]